MFDQRVLTVRDGEIVTDGSWVYAWVRPGDGAVLYVGATGLPVDVRTWLHLNDDDPRNGRIRSHHPDALSGEVLVRGFRLPMPLDRQAVKHAVVALLDGEPVPDGTDAATLDAAHRIVSELAE